MRFEVLMAVRMFKTTTTITVHQDSQAAELPVHLTSVQGPENFSPFLIISAHVYPKDGGITSSETLVTTYKTTWYPS
jgi:hypothetical protein